MDSIILKFINQGMTSPGMYVAMAFVTSWAVWWPFLSGGAVIALVFGNFQWRVMLLAMALSAGISDGVVCKNLKRIAARPRPHQVLAGIRTVDLAKATPRILAATKPLQIKVSAPEQPAVKGNSFPSSHAANMFAMATVFFLFHRRWGGVALGLASLVAFSRMYVGVHWPSDVFAGSLIGVACGWLVVWLLCLAWRQYGERFLPNLHANHPELIKS